MQLDSQPTAASSYARALSARGCPERLAQVVGEILAKTANTLEHTAEEKQLINRAYAYLSD